MVSRQARLGLSIIALSIFVAIVTTRLSPAQSHELSIYRGAPLGYWLGLTLAATTAIIIGVTTSDKRVRASVLFLGTLAISIIAATPFFRGYYFYGIYDPLHHLGIVQDIASGTWSITDVLYPAFHQLSYVLSEVTDIGFERVMLLLVGVFVALYVIGSVTAAKQLTNSPGVTIIAAACAFALLTLNPARQPQLIPSPTVVAMFVWPIGLTILLLAATKRKTAFRLLFVLFSIGLIFYHPQHAIIFLIVSSTLWVAIMVARITQQTGRIAGSKIQYRHMTRIGPGIAIVGIVFATWLISLKSFLLTLNSIIVGLIAPSGDASQLTGTGGIQEAGGDIATVFMRLFFVRFLVAVAVIGGLVYIAAKLIRRRDTPINPLLLILGIGFSSTIIFFGLYIALSDHSQAFRYLAITYVFGTIAFAVLLTDLYAQALERVDGSRSHIVSIGLTVLLVAILIVSIPVMFQSPYIYQPNQQTSESMAAGYDLTFEYTDGPYMDTMTTIHRYRAAQIGKIVSERGLYGYAPVNEIQADVDSERGGSYAPLHFNDLEASIEETTYLTVTAHDRSTHTGMYDGSQFSKDDFNSLDNDPHTSKVISTGDYDLYRIEVDSE